jgi:16S rRNA (uracil1498-N3)-methyltransferase
MSLERLPKARIWSERVAAGPLSLGPEQAHYVSHVLRLRAGDRVTVIGGDGHVAVGVIAGAPGGDVVVQLGTPETQPHPSLELTVGLAAAKGERADWAVEKLTELGVQRIVWLECRRSVVLPKSGGNRQARWQRLAQAAARQAGRASAPSIEGPVGFAEILGTTAGARYIAHFSGEPLGSKLDLAVGRALLLVGPEGGFTSDEVIAAEQAGFVPVSLGPYTLRIETAAVAGAAILLGGADLSSP